MYALSDLLWDIAACAVMVATLRWALLVVRVLRITRWVLIAWTADINTYSSATQWTARLHHGYRAAVDVGLAAASCSLSIQLATGDGLENQARCL